jgi:hypothetical protein
MPVDVRGRVSYDPNVKNNEPEYTLDCKQLGIEEDGSGDIETDIETLRHFIEYAIVKEFKVEPKAVQITGYTLSLNFSIEGAINRSLDEFTGKEGETEEA